MKRTINIIISLSLVLICFSCNDNLIVKESSFSKSLVAGKYVLEANDGWWHWGMAPIYDKNEKLHVFMSAIPTNGSWLTDSKIVHYIADKPEGPYQFVDTVFTSNKVSYHNPQVSKAGDVYVLVFLLKNDSTSARSQEIGLATSKSLYGPWVESPYNPIIKASGQMNGANVLHASNPSFLVDENGKYRIYYKSMTDKYFPKTYREISMAMSDNIEGPYTNCEENPLISYADKHVDIEDPYVFYYKGMYYMIVEDRLGVRDMLEGHTNPEGIMKAGGWRPGLLYKSNDGLKWDRPEIAYQTNKFYFGDKLARSERPNILWKDGKPECLFLACEDAYSSAGFFLKIEGWD